MTEWLIAIAVGIILVILIINFVAKSYTIKGDSMNPTLKDGDHVLVNIIGYKVGTVKKGMSLSSMLTKRMIMLNAL